MSVAIISIGEIVEKYRWLPEDIVAMAEYGATFPKPFGYAPYSISSLLDKEAVEKWMSKEPDEHIKELGYAYGNRKHWELEKDWAQKDAAEKRQEKSGKKATLYRHFNHDGILLYIGQSISKVERALSHTKNKMWKHEVALVKMELHPLEDIDQIEKEAIRNEKPLYNKVHNAQ